MSNGPNPTEIRGSELSDDQLKNASDFLAGWVKGLQDRKPSRQDMVRLIAWYGAIRYQSGAYGIGTLEKPNRITPTIKKEAPPTPSLGEEFEITDLQFIPLRTR